MLQRNNIHLKVCPEGEVTATLAALRQSAATARHKAKFILATDGKSFEAENLGDGETVACVYADFSDHFGFFLPLAGSLRAGFGVCGNEVSDVDGRVVSVEYGCGAHSEVRAEPTPLAERGDPVYDDGDRPL